MEYKYGMRLRGYSIGCQPINGFVRRESDSTGAYHDIIVYDRSLNEKEREQYELDDLNPKRLSIAEYLDHVKKYWDSVPYDRKKLIASAREAGLNEDSIERLVKIAEDEE